MSIIIEKTSDFLQREWPALFSWIPCKEQGSAVAIGSINDYAKGVELPCEATPDIALDYAIRVPGNAAAGAGFYDGVIGTELTVAADEHLIVMGVGINLNIADTYIYYGRANGNSAIYLSDAGVPKIKASGTSYSRVTAPSAGVYGIYLGVRRDTDTLESQHCTNLAALGTFESLDASALGAIDFSGGTATNGLYIYNGASGADPAGLYQLVIAKFRGDFPDHTTVIGPALQTMVTECQAGTKNLPAFMRSLTV